MRRRFRHERVLSEGFATNPLVMGRLAQHAQFFSKAVHRQLRCPRPTTLSSGTVSGEPIVEVAVFVYGARASGQVH